MPDGIVKREDFDKIDNQDAKLGVLFETIIELKDEVKGLKKGRKGDTMVAAGMGFVGGFSAVCAKMLFWK